MLTHTSRDLLLFFFPIMNPTNPSELLTGCWILQEFTPNLETKKIKKRKKDCPKKLQKRSTYIRLSSLLPPLASPPPSSLLPPPPFFPRQELIFGFWLWGILPLHQETGLNEGWAFHSRRLCCLHVCPNSPGRRLSSPVKQIHQTGPLCESAVWRVGGVGNNRIWPALREEGQNSSGFRPGYF